MRLTSLLGVGKFDHREVLTHQVAVETTIPQLWGLGDRATKIYLIESHLQLNPVQSIQSVEFCSTIYLIGLIYQIDVLHIYIYTCNVYAQSNANQSDFKESIYPILSIITSYLVLLILSDLSAHTYVPHYKIKCNQFYSGHRGHSL
jgi:hypothetical protein